jgi:Flp pilus assembly pilin Flp
VGQLDDPNLTPEETIMLDFIKNFRADEDGAVTVDWVVLTAAIVGLGIAVVVAVRSGTVGMGNNISNELSSTTVPDIGGAMNTIVNS